MIATATPTIDTIDALKTARGRKTGAIVFRGGSRQTTTATNGEVWATISSPSDGGPDGWQVFEPGNVAEAPAMGPATFACALHWRQVVQVVHGVVPATDTETSRYALGGTQLECRQGSMLTVIGTDGRRMHVAWLQPASIAGETAQYCIVPADAWRRLHDVSRAAVRRLRGVAGAKLDRELQRASVTIETDGTVCRLTWGAGDLTVAIVARLIEGRFPRWRDCVDPAYGVGEGVVVEIDTLAADVAEFGRLHRAAVAAGRDAWMAEPVAPRASKRRPTEYRHDRGLWLRRAGLEGRGCSFTSDTAGAPNAVCLDHAFLADGLTAAALFAPVGTAVVRAEGDPRFGGKVTGPCVIEAGGLADGGERLAVVIMPLAID